MTGTPDAEHPASGWQTVGLVVVCLVIGAVLLLAAIGAGATAAFFAST